VPPENPIHRPGIAPCLWGTATSFGPVDWAFWKLQPMTRYKSYAEKLGDPRWQRKRLLVMDHDGWRCIACRCMERTLNVHHLKYHRGMDPWDYPMEELVTLCWKCHAAIRAGMLAVCHDCRMPLTDANCDTQERLADGLRGNVRCNACVARREKTV
jgi:hypothetical protein